MIGAALLLAPAIAAAQSSCPRAQLPAYSHNDYRNSRPLVEALSLGYRGVEADIFLVDGVLRLGHERKEAVKGGTLEAAYLIPLQALVRRCGQLARDGRPLLLTVELKEASPPTYEALLAMLGRYRSLLAPQGGSAAPVIVVLVGWHPPAPVPGNDVEALLTWQTRLERPDQRFGGLDARIRMISLDYGKTAGRRWVSRTTRARWIEALRAAKAAAPDRLLRVHNVPVDAKLYAALLEAGVDLIGTERIAPTARLLSVGR